MKTVIGNIIPLSIVGMLFLSTMAIFPASAAEEIYVTPAANPPTPTPYIGYKWNITVWMKDYNNPDVFAWAIKITYGAVTAKINVTRAWTGGNLVAAGEATPDYIFAGRAVCIPGAVIDPIRHTLLLGESLLGGKGERTPPDPALLCKIEFEILGAPNKFETLSTPISFIDVDTYLLDTALNSRHPIETGGTYAWVWVAPTTSPKFAVVPALTEINPSSYSAHVIGTQFNVQVVLENLDVGWAVTALSFTVKFNTTIIDTEAANITVNVVDWDGPWVVTVTRGVPDRIDLFVSTTKCLGGDVLVSTITFTAMNLGCSPLDIQDEYLEDHVGPVPTDPSVDGRVLVGKHDGALLDVAPNKHVVSQGYDVSIDMTIQDQGDFHEIFHIALFCDDTLVGEKSDIDLAPSQSRTLTFMWSTSGFAKGNYTISAYLEPVADESDTTDNTLLDSWVIIAIVGDITGPTLEIPDGVVDIRDVAFVATGFGSYPSHPRWKPTADINNDGKVDIRDIAIVAKNFGKTDP